jgi:hypothetical protein
MPRSISKQPPASVEYFTVWERQVRRDTHHVIQRTNTNSPPTLRRWGEVGEVESASAKNSRGFDFAQSVCGACASVTRHFSPFKSTLRTTVGGWRQIPRENKHGEIELGVCSRKTNLHSVTKTHRKSKLDLRHLCWWRFCAVIVWENTQFALLKHTPHTRLPWTWVLPKWVLIWR